MVIRRGHAGDAGDADARDAGPRSNSRDLHNKVIFSSQHIMQV